MQRIGIKTSSIHYHFPSKGDLGRALVERYRASFQHAHLFRSDMEPAKEAAALFAALEGAMIVARGFGDRERFTRTSSLLLASLETP